MTGTLVCLCPSVAGKRLEALLFSSHRKRVVKCLISSDGFSFFTVEFFFFYSKL